MSQCRTYPDGFDCEVIGKDLFKWLDETCRDPYEREHVTVRLQADRPHWARVGHCLSYCDNSHLKISVDTEEDLNFVRMYAELMQSKINFAKNNGEVTIRW